MKSNYFTMAPEGLDDLPCLQRWLTRPGINPRAVCYAVIRMIGRVARNRNKRHAYAEVLYGLNNKNIPYLMLKEILTTSGLFECSAGCASLNYAYFRFYLYPAQNRDNSDSEGRCYFVRVPEGLEKDPRLQPWMKHDHVSAEALCYTVVNMMERLAASYRRCLPVKSLIAGNNSKNMSCKFLESLITESGFFDVRDGYVLYNWERFCDNPCAIPSPDDLPSRPQSGPCDKPENSLVFRSSCPENARELPETPPTHPATSPEASPITSAREIFKENNIKKIKKTSHNRA